ncbi:hypothetical protein K505DRAFT_368431 [Melanomma pulvis-pyrius CBS 109.77]|uniref:Uncharacterized protein n=1 Tax=Melanomma pulvis-pyrius CBS 109.77 TaxID=1314802 RepID=A0A6A6WQF9_9PLEO|nr:hypothetical protein K505DRAFT_368431 [Melanomma pulvis-pyrius CBS 109.77]
MTNTLYTLESPPAVPFYHQPPLPSLPQPPTIVSKVSVCKFLQVDGLRIQQEYEQASSMKFEGSLDEVNYRSRAADLLGHARLDSWSNSITSDILVFRPFPVDYHVSHRFAADVVNALREENPSNVVLHAFFPTPAQDFSRGPFYLLRSLVYGLLWYSKGANFTTKDLDVPAWEPYHLRWMFERMLYSLEFGTTVYIVIHGLGNYAVYNQAETHLVLRLLDKLASLETNLQLRVKVLLTPPFPLMAENIILPEKYVDISANCN